MRFDYASFRLAFSPPLSVQIGAIEVAFSCSQKERCHLESRRDFWSRQTRTRAASMTAVNNGKGTKSASKNLSNMKLHFISKVLSTDGRPSHQLKRHIEDVLSAEGDPVRWAIVEADEHKMTVRVDAVVSRYE